MATTKKTVKSDATDKKKTATSKKTTTTKKKTTVKKEVESTGVVEEFLNENLGKVITETPVEEENPKKGDEIKEEIVQQPETKPVVLPKEEKKKKTNKKKTASKAKKGEEEKIKDAEAQINDAMKETVTPVEESEGIVTNEEREKTPEEKWNDLGLTNEIQEEIKEVVKEIDNEKDETGVDFIEKWKKLNLSKGSDEENKKMISELIEETKAGEQQKPEKKEETIVRSVDDLRVKLQPKEEQQKFNYVNISMGVRFD